MDESGFDAKETSKPETNVKKEKSYAEMSIEKLSELLRKAVENEQYEEASKIKSEIDRRNNEQSKVAGNLFLMPFSIIKSFEMSQKVVIEVKKYSK